MLPVLVICSFSLLSSTPLRRLYSPVERQLACFQFLTWTGFGTDGTSISAGPRCNLAVRQPFRYLSPESCALGPGQRFLLLSCSHHRNICGSRPPTCTPKSASAPHPTPQNSPGQLLTKYLSERLLPCTLGHQAGMEKLRK